MDITNIYTSNIEWESVHNVWPLNQWNYHMVMRYIFSTSYSQTCIQFCFLVSKHRLLRSCSDIREICVCTIVLAISINN